MKQWVQLISPSIAIEDQINPKPYIPCQKLKEKKLGFKI
jgi:hypothetical protein